MSDAEEMIDVALDDRERSFLRSALNEWRGPARCTEELAVAMGFRDLDDFDDRIEDELLPALRRHDALTRLDWLRVLLASEIAFGSVVLGVALDWPATVGLSDEESLRILRGLQRKIGGQVGHLVGAGFGTRREPEASP